MSYTHTRMISHTRNAVYYELYGTRGSKSARNLAATGHTRVAAISCDYDDPWEFVDLAEMTAEKYGRKVESQSLIQSFKLDEFHVNDQEQIDHINAMGYELAKRLHPDSDALVITHVDGAGGHPHNHIKVMNHVNATKQGLRENRLPRQVRYHNDELMRENNLPVIEPDFSRDQARYWEMERNRQGISTFEQDLGDLIEQCLLDRAVTDSSSFKVALGKRGIELQEKEYTIKEAADGSSPERASVGWTYVMQDDTGPRSRKRRRKASGLSDDFTKDGVERIFHEKAKIFSSQQEPVVAPVQNIMEGIDIDEQAKAYNPGSDRKDHYEGRSDTSGRHGDDQSGWSAGVRGEGGRQSDPDRGDDGSDRSDSYNELFQRVERLHERAASKAESAGDEEAKHASGGLDEPSPFPGREQRRKPASKLPQRPRRTIRTASDSREAERDDGQDLEL